MYYLWKLTISQAFSLTHSICIYFPSSLFLYHFPTLYFICLLSNSSATFSFWFSFSLLTPLLLSLFPFLFWIPHRYLPSFLLSSCPLLFSSLLSSPLFSSPLPSSPPLIYSSLLFPPLLFSPPLLCCTPMPTQVILFHIPILLFSDPTSLLWPCFSIYLGWPRVRAPTDRKGPYLSHVSFSSPQPGVHRSY